MYYTKNILFDIKLSHQYKEISIGIPLFRVTQQQYGGVLISSV